MKKLFQLMAITAIAILSVGFMSCGDDDDDNNNPNTEETNTPTSQSDLIGWWMVNVADDYSFKGVTKSSYRALHFIDDYIVDVLDITKERQWFTVDVTGDNEFATTIDGTNYYYLNRSTYMYIREGKSILLPSYPYSNNTFYISGNQIIRDSERYYKVK